MSNSDQQLILASSAAPANRKALSWCGEILAAGDNAEFRLFRQTGDFPESPEYRNSLAELQREIAMRRPALMLTDWPSGESGEAWLRFALNQNLAVVFLRWPDFSKIRRILILSAGGIHVIRQLWIARRTAEACGCPARILHIIRDPEQNSETPPAATRLQAGMLGLAAPVQISRAGDILSGLAAWIKEDDLLIMGAPNHWRLSDHFAFSLPDLIARHFANPMMMMLGHRPEKIRLGDVFWPGMINPGLPSVPKEEAIALLIDCLIRNHQVPPDWREKLLQQALAREQIRSTAVGSETAFPHITMPIRGGLAGCMGIFPGGVDFAAQDQSLSRFVFLFITPDNYYSEYLDVLALLSVKLIQAEIRRRLADCRTSAEVLSLLDPEPGE